MIKNFIERFSKKEVVLPDPPVPKNKILTPDAEKLSLLQELGSLDTGTIHRALWILRRVSEIDMVAALGQPIPPEHLQMAHSVSMAGVYAMDCAIGLLENLKDEIDSLKK